ncbi:hypothetical protein, partial [Candidatus Venteria ishoeyi]|uniref:hypothetical protein n=1 Tax=Candidatus Venteria ishoeyi TaxID=1899563 RepID=UPI0011B0E7CA
MPVKEVFPMLKTDVSHFDTNNNELILNFNHLIEVDDGKYKFGYSEVSYDAENKTLKFNDFFPFFDTYRFEEDGYFRLASVSGSMDPLYVSDPEKKGISIKFQEQVMDNLVSYDIDENSKVVFENVSSDRIDQLKHIGIIEDEMDLKTGVSLKKYLKKTYDYVLHKSKDSSSTYTLDEMKKMFNFTITGSGSLDNFIN